MIGALKNNLWTYTKQSEHLDLNPEWCKDYTETGYCSYGDTCIFIHDRSEHKTSYQLEKEWLEEQKRKQEQQLKAIEEEDEEDKEVRCLICEREPV